MGKRIAAKRKSLGLKQVEVNEMAELSDKYLSHIETARTKPSIDVLMKICAVLNTTPDHILLGLEERPDYISKNVLQKIKLLPEHKQEFLSKFVDLLVEQEI